MAQLKQPFYKQMAYQVPGGNFHDPSGKSPPVQDAIVVTTRFLDIFSRESRTKPLFATVTGRGG